MAGNKSVDAKDAEKGKRGRKGKQERVRKQGPVTADRKR
jgi:Ethanolamine utilization protein EutJ (predicted chaperonin)